MCLLDSSLKLFTSVLYSVSGLPPYIYTHVHSNPTTPPALPLPLLLSCIFLSLSHSTSTFHLLPPTSPSSIYPSLSLSSYLRFLSPSLSSHLLIPLPLPFLLPFPLPLPLPSPSTPLPFPLSPVCSRERFTLGTSMVWASLAAVVCTLCST